MKCLVLSKEEIQSICKNLGKQISDDLREETAAPVFIGVMKGALNFYYDLLKYIDINITTDFMQVSSYFGTGSEHNVKLVRNIKENIKNRVVILVEDIIDSGNSMKFLIDYLNQFEPKKILIVSLFDKINAREVDVKVDYTGRQLVKNDFLVGYGLDYKEFLRNVPYVYIPDEEEIKELDALYERSNVK